MWNTSPGFAKKVINPVKYVMTGSRAGGISKQEIDLYRSAHETAHFKNDDGNHLATVVPVETESMIKTILDSSTKSGDGRSPWVWVRLANGDLLLGMFPQGETYMLDRSVERERP
jgi:hypothetical protein